MPIEEPIENSKKENVRIKKTITKNAGLGFSAAVLSILPFEIYGDSQGGTTHHYKIKKVEEHVFRPSRLYVQESVQQPDIHDFLAKRNYRKAVYMIVGVRIGCDAVVIHERNKERGGKFNATAPGFATGIPVDLGVKIHAKRSKDSSQRERLPNSFVFAYRLREVRYFKKTKSAKDFDYTKDADLHDISTNKITPLPVVPETKYIGSVDEIEIDGIAGVDFEEDEHDTEIVDGCIIVE